MRQCWNLTGQSRPRTSATGQELAVKMCCKDDLAPSANIASCDTVWEQAKRRLQRSSSARNPAAPTGRAGLLPNGESARAVASGSDNAGWLRQEKYAHRAQKRTRKLADHRDEQDRKAAAAVAHSRLDRAIEPIAGCQFRRQHTGGEYRQDGAGEKRPSWTA